MRAMLRAARSFHAGIIEYEDMPGSGCFAGIVITQRTHADAMCSKFLFELFVALLRMEAQQEVQAGAAFEDIGAREQSSRFHSLEQGFAALAVAVAHAVDVLLEITVLDEAGQRILLEVRYRAAVETEFLVEFPDELFRQHHVADADGRGQRLGEGIHVDDPAADIDAHHRRDGPSRQTEFAVVVILDDAAARCRTDPPQESVAAADGSDAAGREVM